jgi:hypothetical protein
MQHAGSSKTRAFLLLLKRDSKISQLGNKQQAKRKQAGSKQQAAPIVYRIDYPMSAASLPAYQQRIIFFAAACLLPQGAGRTRWPRSEICAVI